MQMEQVYRQKMTVKSDENDEIFIIQYLIWLGFQIYLVKSLKSICQAPLRLINKRALICDHRKYWSKIWMNVCLLWKIFVYFYKFWPNRFLRIKDFNFLKIFHFWLQKVETLESIISALSWATDYQLYAKWSHDQDETFL